MEFGEVGAVAALNLRIRTVLSVLRTIAAHMAAHACDSDESALHLCGRIGAIGRVALQPGVCGGVDLESLVLEELRAHAAPAERSCLGGPQVRLPPLVAEWVSLIIHELATNAVKYGALCQSRAKIMITWEMSARDGARVLLFEWSECGVLIPDPSAAPGFGRVLIERLIARHLGGKGTMTFLPDGVRYTIAIPVMDAHEVHG